MAGRIAIASLGRGFRSLQLRSRPGGVSFSCAGTLLGAGSLEYSAWSPQRSYSTEPPKAAAISSNTWHPLLRLARLDKHVMFGPIGTWLLYWPGAWSIAMAAPAGQLPDIRLLATFGVGAVIMRGAGCTINDMWDVDFDRQVERTRERPLANGELSMKQAWAFLAAQLTAGLGVLCTLNPYSIGLGACSMGLVCTYPLFKRITWWPQLVLGLTFNWGALLGWAAVTGTSDWAVTVPLYAAGVSWTLVYDTIYAHQDKVDDERVGIKSTARRFGDNTQQWLAGFSACTVAGLSVAGANAGLDPYFYGAGMTFTAAHLAWQVSTMRIDDTADCHRKFVSNKWIGAAVFTSIVASRALCGV